MQAIYSLAFVLAVLVALTIAEGPTEEKKKFLDECKAQENATDNDVQQFLNRQIPNGPNSKCFLACIYEKSGAIKDGKVNADAIKANILKQHDDKATSTANEVAEACKGITNADRCELGFLLADCVMKTLSKKQ